MRGGKRTTNGGEDDAKGVPGVREVRAIFVSDLHLQARPPVARSAEPDWWEAMRRPLDEIMDLSVQHECPVLYAGDIFNRWDAGPEVINFALRHLPKGYAVPGQHDLPNHNYEEIHRSAYGTLVEARRLVNIPPGKPMVCGGLSVTGFPWGVPPVPLNPRSIGSFAVALIHRFVWIKGCGYPGAAEDAYLDTKALQGYDVAIYGDNHKGFLVKPTRAGSPWVINCGGFMRRKTDERDYKPGIGLLMGDGSVQRHYLNTELDKFTALTAAEEAIATTLDMSRFVDELKGLGAGDALNFWDTMKKFLDTNNVRKEVRNVIMEDRSGG